MKGLVLKPIKKCRKETRKARRDADFFPTPPEITAAFLRAEGPFLKDFSSIWEPACGDGAMAKVMIAHGYDVFASDIRYRGYGHGTADFLKLPYAQAAAGVTNPPYKDNLPERFIRHAADIGMEYIALLLKANFFHTQGRVALFSEFRPVREYKICWRPDFLNLGGGMMDVSWFVFDFRRKARATKVYILTKDGRRL